MRLFVAIDLDDAARAAIGDEQKRLMRAFGPTDRALRWVDAEQMHVIEFALVRLRYRYGASIDDILLDPDLGEKFEQLASELAPGLRDVDLRLGALYIRKTRHFEKKDIFSFNPHAKAAYAYSNLIEELFYGEKT